MVQQGSTGVRAVGAREELLDPRVLARLESVVRLARRVPADPRRGLRLPGRGLEHGARRPYEPGDDLRLVDWPAFARFERLFLKLPEDLPPARLDLVLDGSGSTACGEPAPAVRLALAAAALAAAATARQTRTFLWWAGEHVARHVSARPAELVRLLRFLSERRPAGDGSGVARAASRLARTSRFRGEAVLLSDGLEVAALLEAAARLGSEGFSVHAVVAEVRDELSSAVARTVASAGTADLVDAESGQRRRLPWSGQLADRAGAARSARLATLARGFAVRGVPCEFLGTEEPFERVAWDRLRMRPARHRAGPERRSVGGSMAESRGERQRTPAPGARRAAEGLQGGPRRAARRSP